MIVWNILLTIALVVIWFRKPSVLKIDGFTIDVQNNFLVIKNDKGEVIFKTGK